MPKITYKDNQDNSKTIEVENGLTVMEGSANIIDASFKALVDSLDYKLFKDNAPASL